jgi:hypothetical protein
MELSTKKKVVVIVIAILVFALLILEFANRLGLKAF